MAMSVTNISEVESYYVPAEHDTIFNLDSIDKENDPGKAKGGGGGGAKNPAAKPPAPDKKAEVASSAGGNKPGPPQANSLSKLIVPANPAAPAAPQKASAPGDAGKSKLQNLQHWCQQHSDKLPYEKIPASKLNYIVYDDRHQFLFCQIPGAVLNDMRKVMLITTKVVNKTSPSLIPGGDVFGKYGKSLKRLTDIQDPAQRAKILSTYSKVLFVRDPLERLLDTYKTKFKAASSKYFHQVFGSAIIKKYRKGATEAEIKSGSSVKFPEFVRYIVDVDQEGKSAFNEHWQQFYKQCHPCMVDYTFLGTHENAEADVRALLQQLRVDGEVKPPYVNAKLTMSEKELTAAYKEVDVQTLKKLYKVYQPDYTLFGYTCPSFLHSMLEAHDAFHDY
ncbi:hypothetical protein EGW08_012779 [Elysia chlorotica]|uniref:Carbohydrate sulfotransferase n=1 Tax=Elysia chlorotica TaxID=188477 RepID=A0A433TD10_ELYCH|nr:hypothetical protein EGW08_012779 [Elysia chlorotica]